MAYIEDIGTDHAWRSRAHEFYYPTRNLTTPTVTVPTAKSPIGRPWDTQEEFVEDLKALRELTVAKPTKGNKYEKIEQNKRQAKYPLRTMLQSTQAGATEQTILANHFEIKIDANCLYEYEILDLDVDGRTRKRIQALFQRAIDSWPHLSSNKDSFATDKRKIIVSWKNLHENLSSQPETPGHVGDHAGAVWPAENITGGTNPITARLKFVGKVDIQALIRQSKADFSEVASDLSSVERCLNILISKSFNEDALRLSTNKFFVKSARDALRYDNRGTTGVSKSLEIIRGYYYAIKPGTGHLLMNFNVATSAFFRPILVSQFVDDGLTFEDRVTRMNILSKLRVHIEPTHKEERFTKLGARIKTITSMGEGRDQNIENLWFHKKLRNADGTPQMENGQQKVAEERTYVIDHLKEAFNIERIETGRPAVNCGTTQDPAWYAQELLRIVPYQLFTRPVPDCLTGSMVEKAAYNPGNARSLVEQEGLSHMGFAQSQNVKTSFRNGVPLSIYPTMMQVKCARMPFPDVQYAYNRHAKGEGQKLPPAQNRSGWNLSHKEKFHFSSMKTLRYFVIQNLDTKWAQDRTAGCLGLLDQNLANQMNLRCDLDIEKVVRLNPGVDATSLQNIGLEAKVAEAQQSKADFVILVMPTFDRYMYPAFKNLVDRKYGMRSICIAKPELLEKDAAKYMSNIVHKVNFKTGGINSYIKSVEALLGKSTLVLGADVVHPGITSFEESPSIACIVGSVDAQAGRFLGSARLQSKDKTDREIIDHVQEMVEERIKDWMAATNTKKVPDNIVYYRDGVSEGQYDKVVSIELSAIQKAWKAIKAANEVPGGTLSMGFSVKSVRIAAIVGAKRHHTRFYPMKKADMDEYGNNNCKPGTCVDTVVTSPYFQDFFLQSHSGIKGTARPTHYFILRNDKENALLGKQTEIRKLTHQLCYTYCRTTGGVSYATPTYYADRLCDRARMYLPKTWSGNDNVFAGKLDAAKVTFTASRQTARNVLHRSGQPFQAGVHVKNALELQDESEDAEALRSHIRGLVLAHAQKEFYEHKGTGVTTGNPWHDNLANVMFWM